MEDLIDDDDDFGAIYADVEVQASSAVNSISNFAKLYTEEEVVKEECNNNNTTKQVHPILNNGNLGSVSDSKQLNSICEKLCNSVADGSDSEDDLNIVLNEDCRGFPVAVEGNGNQDGFGEDGNEDEVGFCGVKKGCAKNGLNPNANGHGGERGNGVKGSYNLPYPQYKNVKPYGLPFPSNNKVNESLEMASSSSKSAKGDMEDNRCKQLKISNTGQVANIRGSANSIVSHGGYGFSLPWHRTILDVNIDAFEEKRWRYPGVDMSDFFNFGFNEDSWKQYCIFLEQCRQHSHIHSRFQSYESSKHTQAYEIGLEDEKAAQVTVAEDIAQPGFSSKSAEMGERLLGLPKGRAIQVEDSTGERQPTMDLRRPRIWDSDVVIQINVQDFDKNSCGSGEEEFYHMNDNGHESSKSRDMHVDDIKDVHYSGSASEDESPAKTLGNIDPFSMNRCSQPMLESSQMPLDPDNHDRDQNSGADRYHHDKVNAQSIEDIAEEMETVEKVEEENGKNTCKSDQFLIERELYVGDRSHFSLTLSCSGSDSDASRNSGCSILKISGSPLRRQPSGTMLQEPVASDRKCPRSSVTVRKLDNSQYYSRNRRSIQEGRKHQNRRLHRVPEGRIHPHTDSDASPMSRDQLSIDCRSRTGRLNDYHDGENFLYDRQRDFCSYDGERLADNKHPHRKYHQNFRDEMKPHERRNWSEDNLHDRDTDWDCDRRGLSPEGMIPLTCREPNNLVSKYNNFKETDIQWRRKGNNIQSGKKTNRDACLLDHKNLDELMLPKYGRSISAINWKRESLDEKYDSRIPFIGRETNLYGRRVRCGHSPPMNLENSWCMESEDDWDLDQQRLSSWFHRESHEANEGRWKDMMSSRSNMFDSRLAETYGRHRREISGDKFRDSHWLDSYNDINNAEDGIIYVDDQVARRRRKYSWRSGMLHRMQGDSVLRHHDNEFYAEKSSCSYEKSSRRERIHAKYGSSNGWMVVDDMQLEWHRYKMFKRESSARFINRNPNMMSRGEHVRTARRCSDPVDLILGEGKSSGRCSTTESLMSHGKFKKMDLKFAKEPDVLKDFNETRSGKATETGNSKIDGSQDNEKWLDKFSVRGHDEDLDIEEGQIMPEEPIIEDRLEKKHASGIAVPLRSIRRRNFQSQNISSGKEINKGYDDQRILDTLAKMERRRERFKGPAALKRAPDKSLKPQVDLIADTVETKQERPGRKRRWGGS